MPQIEQLGTRAEKTLEQILEAAEFIFAAKGFAATRMADIADEVGIRRASLVYYFKDKQELYDAVLKRVFGGLFERARQAFQQPGPLAARVEETVKTWVDYVAERPSFARLILREIADAAPHPDATVLRQVRPFFELMQGALNEGRRQVSRHVDPVDVYQFASIISGATLFFLTGIPAFAPESGVQKITSRQLEEHRNAMVQLTRYFLSYGGLPDVSAPEKP